MNLSQKIAFNTAVQFIGKLFTAFSTLIVTMLIGWRLGADGMGQYVRITSYVTIWFVLLDFGINPIAVKAISAISDKKKRSESLRENYKMLLGLRTAVTLFILTVATLILLLLPKENYTPTIRTAIVVGYIQIIGQSIVSSSMPVFQVNLTYFWATLANIIGSIISLITSSIVIWRGGGVLEIVTATMFGWVIIAIMTYYFATRHTGFVLPTFEYQKWLGLLKRALPVGLALLFNIVFVKLNMQMLQVLSIPDDVVQKYGNIDEQTGYYGIALRFFENIVAIPFFFSNAIYPTLIQKKGKSIEALRTFMKKAVDMMLTIGIPMSVGGVILAPQIIYFVSGGFFSNSTESEFLPAVPALQVLIAGIGIFFTTGVMTWTPIVMDRQWLLPKIYGQILIVTIVLDLLLIPRFGYLGAVAITVIGEVLVFLYHSYYSNKLIGFKYDWNYFGRTLTASVLMGIVTLYINSLFDSPFLAFIPLLAGGLSYLLFGHLFKVIDVNLIKSVFKINT